MSYVSVATKITAVVTLLLSFEHVISLKTSDVKKREFDPNLLMDKYMNMRTNEGIFGSYNPNDVINTVSEFFPKFQVGPTNTEQEQNGQKPNHVFDPNNWGFSIYNPNDGLNYYLGKVSESSLSGSMSSEPTSENHNTPLGMNFNPNHVNDYLMSLLKTDESSYQGGTTDEPLTPYNDFKLPVFDAGKLNNNLFGSLNYDVSKVNSETIPTAMFSAYPGANQATGDILATGIGSLGPSNSDSSGYVKYESQTGPAVAQSTVPKGTGDDDNASEQTQTGIGSLDGKVTTSVTSNSSTIGVNNIGYNASSQAVNAAVQQIEGTGGLGNTAKNQVGGAGSLGNTAIHQIGGTGSLGGNSVNQVGGTGSLGNPTIHQNGGAGSLGNTAVNQVGGTGSLGNAALHQVGGAGSLGSTVVNQVGGTGSLGNTAIHQTGGAGSLGNTAVNQGGAGSFGNAALHQVGGAGSLGSTAVNQVGGTGSLGNTAIHQVGGAVGLGSTVVNQVGGTGSLGNTAIHQVGGAGSLGSTAVNQVGGTGSLGNTALHQVGGAGGLGSTAVNQVGGTGSLGNTALHQIGGAGSLGNTAVNQVGGTSSLGNPAISQPNGNINLTVYATGIGSLGDNSVSQVGGTGSLGSNSITQTGSTSSANSGVQATGIGSLGDNTVKQTGLPSSAVQATGIGSLGNDAVQQTNTTNVRVGQPKNNKFTDFQFTRVPYPYATGIGGLGSGVTRSRPGSNVLATLYRQVKSKNV